MNQELLHILTMYVFLPVMAILIISMFIVSVREKNKLTKNRKKGVIDHYLVLKKNEELVVKILNDKNKTDKQKELYYKMMYDFFEFIDSKTELKIKDVIKTKEKADEFMKRLKDLDN